MTTANTNLTTYEREKDWLRARAAGLGSTDAPAILGISSFKSPLQLYYEKLGLAERPRVETDIMRWGRVLEPAIAAKFAEDTGRQVLDPAAALYPLSLPIGKYTIARHPTIDWLLASPDAVQRVPIPYDPADNRGDPFQDEGDGILEIKNVHFAKTAEWEEEPPLEYMVQLQHQLMVTGLKWGSIAALVGGSRFLYRDVKRDDDLCELILERCQEFWTRLKNEDPPPVDGSEQTRELLARLYTRETGEIVALPPEAIDWHAERKAAILDEKDAQARKLLAENRIKAALGDASAGELPDGTVYTWRMQTRAGHYVKEAAFRVLRAKESKA